MEKENKKVRDKYVKKERSRIIKLSEVSYKKDPRVKKFKEDEENEKVRYEEPKKKEARDP